MLSPLQAGQLDSGRQLQSNGRQLLSLRQRAGTLQLCPEFCLTSTVVYRVSASSKHYFFTIDLTCSAMPEPSLVACKAEQASAQHHCSQLFHIMQVGCLVNTQRRTRSSHQDASTLTQLKRQAAESAHTTISRIVSDERHTHCTHYDQGRHRKFC